MIGQVTCQTFADMFHAKEALQSFTLSNKIMDVESTGITMHMYQVSGIHLVKRRC